MKTEQKAWLTTLVTILLGYMLLKLPVIGFLVECLILLLCINYVYAVSCDFFNTKNKSKNKRSKK